MCEEKRVFLEMQSRKFIIYVTLREQDWNMYELKAKHEGSHACMTNARSEKEWEVDGLWVHFLLPIPCEEMFCS